MATVVLGVVAAGCGRGEPEDTAPLNLRGKPIVAAPAPANGTVGSTGIVVTAAAPVAPAAVASAPTSGPPLAPTALTPDAEGVVHVGFDTLAGFIYPETNQALPADAPLPPSQIPESLRVLNGQAVAVKGFMLPMKLQAGLATELLLMRDQSMCCFGVVPRINEWVSVKMTGRGVKPIQDQPVTIFGKFRAAEEYENGYLVSVYGLAGERMDTALDL